ncbi:MAG: hypothetical protein ACRDY7_12985 [Acidimicrobiia bacterium]
MTRLRLPKVRVALVLAMLVVGGIAGASPAGASGEMTLSFRAVAGADGVRVGMDVLEGAASRAQAVLDSSHESRALAAQPYAPSPGAYPLMVASDHPGVPAQTVETSEHGGYRLRASSNEKASEAYAASGAFDQLASVVASKAVARVADEARWVAAGAVSTFEGVTAGPLHLATVSSSADVRRLPTGELERRSSLAVTGISILGQEVRLTDQGIVAVGATTPLPSSDPLLVALAEAGVTVSYLGSRDTPTGVIAPGLRIETGNVVITLGQASAAVDS